MNRLIRKLHTPIALLLIICLLCGSGSAFAAQQLAPADIQLKAIKTPAQLMCEDYLALLQAQSPQRGWTLDDIAIFADYGTFHGTHVVIIKPINALGTPNIRTLNIAGVTFTFNYGSDIQHFLAWKNRTFYSVSEAYELGYLTRADLLEIQRLRGEAPPEATFYSDVPADAWYYEAVRFVDENGLMQGTGDGKFSPNQSMTRAMLVTVLWRQAGSPSAKAAPFTDVAKNAWYADAVAWAAENKIVNGMGNGLFSPNTALTREQFATILYRQNGEPERTPALGSHFVDKNSISSWALPAMCWAVDQKLLEGSTSAANGLSLSSDPNDRWLNPRETATRAQGAAILMRSQKYAAQPSESIKMLSKGYVSALSEVPAPEEAQCDAIADFSLKLFRASRQEGKNAVMSPLSVLYALAMTANGAKGTTLSQMEDAFGMDCEQTSAALSYLLDSLKDERATVNIANSIWVRDGFSVQENFLQKNADYLHADIFQAPYTPETVANMNNWISRNTDDMIPKMVDSLPAEAVMTFINAILFKADWSDPYTATVERPFYPANGEPQTAKMLCNRENSYIHDDDTDGFLKYFQGGKYAFAVIVPKETVPLEAYLARLDGSSIRSMLQNVSQVLLDTEMPKFKATYDVELNRALSSLGIRDAFHAGTADFSGMAEGLYISDVLHKAVIDVKESGVSAAAATAIITRNTSINIPRKTIIADRPYLYMIVDTQTNLPLFIGTTTTMK